MNLNSNKISDTINPIRGYFKIETLKDGKVIDTEENHNLIMNSARCSFANLLGGIAGQSIINRFVMGTKGHVDDDVLIPKTALHGFNANRVDLFCGTDMATKGESWNELTFTPSSSISNTKAVDIADGASNSSTADVIVTGCESGQPSITYIFNIAQDAFNGTGQGVVYTECALFTDTKIFSMKTFKGKIKEPSVAFRITWQILF